MSGKNYSTNALLVRLRELERENAELREMLGMDRSSWQGEAAPSIDGYDPPRQDFTKQAPAKQDPAVQTIVKFSPPELKIALFRSLFRGREDAFARRWQSAKTGKSGYSPACGNEWQPGVCPKPKGYCSDCKQRELLPLTDAVIDRHLRGQDALGRDVVGVYPILPDDSCRFLALDFDDGGWQENAAAV